MRGPRGLKNDGSLDHSLSVSEFTAVIHQMCFPLQPSKLKQIWSTLRFPLQPAPLTSQKLFVPPLTPPELFSAIFVQKQIVEPSAHLQTNTDSVLLRHRFS